MVSNVDTRTVCAIPAPFAPPSQQEGCRRSSEHCRGNAHLLVAGLLTCPPLVAGLPADVFSFGAIAYEMFYMLQYGENFYDDMNLFTGQRSVHKCGVRVVWVGGR